MSSRPVLAKFGRPTTAQNIRTIGVYRLTPTSPESAVCSSEWLRDAFIRFRHGLASKRSVPG
jgi:hypothetical protein